mgnify:FL=1
MAAVKKASALIVVLFLGAGLRFGQAKEYDCLVLQVTSEVTVQGSVNIGGFKCYTSPLGVEDPLPSCLEKTRLNFFKDFEHNGSVVRLDFDRFKTRGEAW